MVNLFAYQATDPNELKKQANPIGYKNNYHIKTECRSAGLVVAAWGNHGTLNKRNKSILRLLKDVPLKCFNTTKQN